MHMSALGQGQASFHSFTVSLEWALERAWSATYSRLLSRSCAIYGKGHWQVVPAHVRSHWGDSEPGKEKEKPTSNQPRTKHARRDGF